MHLCIAQPCTRALWCLRQRSNVHFFNPPKPNRTRDNAQVLGSKSAVLQRPWSARILGAVSALVSVLQWPCLLIPHRVREHAGSWSTTARDWVRSIFFGTLEFLRTFMPGHVPAPLPARERRWGAEEEAGQQLPQVRAQRRFDTNGRHCRFSLSI
jgi:hypothetical protein